MGPLATFLASKGCSWLFGYFWQSQHKGARCSLFANVYTTIYLQIYNNFAGYGSNRAHSCPKLDGSARSNDDPVLSFNFDCELLLIFSLGCVMSMYGSCYIIIVFKL